MTVVTIRVDSDEDAARITATLTALGYEVRREVDSVEHWIAGLCTAHQLSPVACDVFRRMISGQSNAEIADALCITRAQVKWHMHNIFAATGASNREALLRMALMLPSVPKDG